MMNRQMNTVIGGSCDCGRCTFALAEAPSVRLVCHCTLCQAFTGKDFSDVMIVVASEASLRGEDNVAYRNYKKFRLPPPNLRRGRCKTCLAPFLETGGIWPLQVLFIPVANFDDPDRFPLPEAHMFYEHRRHDVDDGVPKHEGYFSSQAALAKMLYHAL